MNHAKTDPHTESERIDALRLGIVNALGLIEHYGNEAAAVELRARLRNDDEAAVSVLPSTTEEERR